MAWRIYYSDGSTFDSSDGEPDEAPALGFICAVGYRPNGHRYIMHGWDHYFYDRDTEQWWGCELTGLIDQLRLNKVYAYKQGRSVESEVFQELMGRAHRDPDFPQG